MRQVIEIPIGDFAPDQRKRDTLALERAENVIPLFGAYRQIPEVEEVTSIASVDPVTGAHAHLITFRSANQDNLPKSVVYIGDLWIPLGGLSDNDEILADNSDRTYFAWLGDSSPSVDLDVTINVDTAVLDDPETDSFHYLSMRYKIEDFDHMSAFTLYCRIMEGVTEIAAIEITESDPDQEGFSTKVITLSDPEAASITDYTALSYQIFAEKTVIPGSVSTKDVTGIAAVDGAWNSDDEDPERELYEYLQVVTDYLQSEKSVSIQDILCTLDPVVKPTDFDDVSDATVELTVKAEVESEFATADAKVALFKLGDATPIKETDPAVSVPDEVDGARTSLSLDITAGDLRDLEDPDWNSLRIAVSLQPTGSGSPVDHPPDEERDNDVWYPVGESTNLEVLETSTPVAGKYVTVPLDTTARSLMMRCAPITEPVAGSVVKVYASISTLAGYAKLDLGAYNGNTKVQSKTVGTTANQSTRKVFNFTLSESKWSEINWANFNIRLRKPAISPAVQIAVHRVWVEVEEATGGSASRVYQLLAEQRTIAGFKVSNVRFDVPVAGKQLAGDTSLIYCGTKKSLFQATTVGFQDVSKTSDASYDVAVSRPASSWKFCSWGNKVIATDGNNPVQVQNSLSARFEDLFESDEKPYLRLIAVVKDILVGANVMLAQDTSIPAEGQVDFNEFQVWWTEINDPTEIHYIDLSRQSGWQPLYHPAGELLALTGGESGTLYKRNSIHRMNYIGSPWVFDFDVISYNEGTAFGRSIVQIDQDQFFLGNGGFRMIPFQGGVTRLGDGVVTKMFIDSLNEDRAIMAYFDADTAIEVESAVVSAYDPLSGLIHWIYRGLSQNGYKNASGICFNPGENRFSHLKGVNLQKGISEIVAQANVQLDSRSIHRSMVLFSWDDETVYRNQFSETRYREGVIGSKKFTSKFFSDKPKSVVTVHGIRIAEETDYNVSSDTPVRCEFRVVIIGALDPAFTCGVIETDQTSDSEILTDSGWMMFDEPVSGEYFTVTIYLPESEDQVIREITSYELDLEMGEGEE